MSNSNKKFDTRYMVELAMMIAIIILMAFTPLGYLRTPGLSITILTIPVAVGAIILGPRGGAICGLAFGATSFYMALTGSSSFAAMLLSINPFGTFITCIVARVLEGWLTGLIFAALYKKASVRLRNNFSYLSFDVVYTVLLYCSSVELIEVLTWGTHINIEDCYICIRIFIADQHCMFCCVHTADLGAVWLSSVIGTSASHALDKYQLFRSFSVGKTL